MYTRFCRTSHVCQVLLWVVCLVYGRLDVVSMCCFSMCCFMCFPVMVQNVCLPIVGVHCSLDSLYIGGFLGIVFCVCCGLDLFDSGLSSQIAGGFGIVFCAWCVL